MSMISPRQMTAEMSKSHLLTIEGENGFEEQELKTFSLNRFLS